MVPVKRKLAPQDILFKEGDASTSFFVVLAGVVSLFNERNGKAIEKTRLASNAIVGDLVFSNPQKRPYSVRAVTDCDIVEFPFDQIQGDLKTLPGWTQLMLRSLPDQLMAAQKELRELKGEDNSTKLTADDIIRGLATLRLATASLEPEAGKWYWEKVREFAIQTFQFPALKLDPLARVLADAGWLQLEIEQSEISKIASLENTPLLEFENFVRYYRYSRSKRGMIEVSQTDLTILTSLLMAAEGKIDAKGAARIELPAALAIAQKLPGGSGVRVDQYDLIAARGLDVSKESTDSGLRLVFNYAELQKINAYWKVLLAL